MNVADYTRDPQAVKKAFQATEDGALIAKKPCAIYVPRRFHDKELAVIDNEIYVVGIHMVVVDNSVYAVNLTNAMMRIAPSSINNVVMNDKDTLEFSFEPGDAVYANINLVENNKLLYFIFDEIIARGNVPPFMDYNDLGRLFDSAVKHAGVQLTSTPTVLHLLIASISRDPQNPQQYFRQVTNGRDLEQVRFVQMRSGTFGATNTTARIMGAYFTDSLTSALVNPSDREENIERILRQ